LAIIFPEIHFYPLDSVAKKLKCVDEFAEQLNLKNIHILNGRAEALAHEKQHREKYEMIVTRAFANFSPMLEMTMGFLKEKHYLLAYRGPEHNLDNDDLVLDYFGGFAENVFYYNLPTKETRELWQIKKVEPMMPQFPRHIGTPKKEPISGDDL
jgi:16S rRNA (guanine527-N7)-methyltransferase